MKNYLLTTMNRTEAEERSREGAVVVLPVGSTEQHGEHLPLDTDAFLAYEIAKGSASLALPQVPVVVAPPVTVGCSKHHLKYPGTLSLEYETFIAMTYDICHSLSLHGFKKLIIINGHGGNMAGINITANKLMLEEKFSLVVATNYFSLIASEINEIRESECGGMGHAGEFETSLSLYLRPDLVAKDKMHTFIPSPRLTGDSLDLVKGSSYLLPWIVHKDTPIGVIGNPLLASAEKGEKFYQAVTGKICNLICEMYHK